MTQPPDSPSKKNPETFQGNNLLNPDFMPETFSEETRAALERLQNASPEEIWQSLVDAGVYTSDNLLRKKYGGTLD